MVWMASLVCLYLFGVLWIGLRLLIAYRRLKHIHRVSRPVNVAIESLFEKISGPSGKRVELRLSSQVSAPITWGIRTPVILLPESIMTDTDGITLKYFLAHEWAHVHRRDAWTWLLAICLQAILFYQPLYWIARRMLLITMDRLADAEAAGQGESPFDYAEFLVRLARDRRLPIPALSLGVNDKNSQLKQRVEHLIESGGVQNLLCSRRRGIVIGLIALTIAVCGAFVRFEKRLVADDQEQAKPAEGTKGEAHSQTSNHVEPKASNELLAMIVNAAAPQIGELLKVACSKREDGSIIYTGFVTNAENHLPIAGAKIKVRHRLSRDPETGGWSTIEITEHTSDAMGMYNFKLPPEQVAQKSLYIEVQAEHPDYAQSRLGGYSHDMIVKNLEMGELPFYTHIGLWPGVAIEGTVVSTEGKPLKDVEILTYCESSKSKDYMGSFGNTTTDAAGKFRIVPPTPGDGVLWIKPNDYSPQAHRIADRRGNWGEIRVTKDATITGRVIDLNGNPVSNVEVEARRFGDGDKVDEYLNSNSVANNIGRTSPTQSDGTFVLNSLPDGDYQIQVHPNAKKDDYAPKPLKHVFLMTKIKIENRKSQQITIQAVPHVMLYGLVVDSNNDPCSGHEAFLMGQIEDDFYFARTSVPGKDGKFEVSIPHGLREAKLDLMTNEHGALRWRMSRDKPLHRGRDVNLGTVEDDIRGFEVVRYKAPILLVKVVDEQGKIIRDAGPTLTYLRPTDELEEMTVYIEGGNVSFEKQGDGRYRSSSLLPDELVSVRIAKEGFETTPQEVTLKEGETREIQFLLKPVKQNEKKPEAK